MKINRKMAKRDAASMLLKVANGGSHKKQNGKKRTRETDNDTNDTTNPSTEMLWKMTDKHAVSIKEISAQQSWIRNEINSLRQMMSRGVQK